MKISLAQLDPTPNDLRANVEVVLATIASKRGGDLVVFPELFLCSCPARDYQELSVALSGPETASIRAAAVDAAVDVVVGAAVHTERGIENQAIAIAAGGGIASIAKTHQWADEARNMVAGDRIEPIPVGGRAAGVMVCFDVEFPEVARSHAVQGAEMLITISANMIPWGPDHATFVRSRALENKLVHVYVNRVGNQSEVEYVGGSCVIDPYGRTLAQADEHACVLDVDVDLDGFPMNPDVNYLRLIRPELYARAEGAVGASSGS
jgi:predicted amidohydrolase